MVESELLAEGSVSGFLSGKHFNRCKKLHAVAALSLKILHFRAFIKFYEKEDDFNKIHLDEVAEILELDSRNLTSADVTLPMLKNFLDQYAAYTEETLTGKHGRTTQFAMMYVSLIELYQLYERGIRTSDVALYNYAAFEICALFFTFNHQNYARWLVRNHNSFANIETTHPGLLEQFEKGALSIRRTSKNFCRSPIDLTLEQTVNANAVNRLTGISAFTNNLQARQRWSETHTARTAVISNFLEFVELGNQDSSDSKYLSKIFTQQVKKFTDQICGSINPFDGDISPNELFNLSSGKAAAPETADFLANVMSIGVRQRDNFIEECCVDSARFNRPIKRNAIKTFSAENVKTKKSTTRKMDDASLERNVLGHLLCHAMDKKMDLLHYFSYPLTAIPLSLAHLDGTMISNGQKGELTNLLNSKSQGESVEHAPPKFDVEMIDGFYYLSTLRESPAKYGEFAEFLLKRICDCDAFEIHIIFDRDETSSVRDLDIKKNLYDDSTQYEIKGPGQERTGTLSKLLANSSFRNELVLFLIDHWASGENNCTILGEKRIFVSYGEKCYLYSKHFEMKKVVSIFENNHVEIESKMVLHLEKINAKNILIKVTSTDTLIVYLLYHMQFWQIGREIWIQTGDVTRNTLQLINVGTIFKHFSPNFINALPAWYVFSGCRYEPSFYGKGRKSCLKILEKNSEYQAAFGRIGNKLDTSESDISTLDEYTCQLYHIKAKTVNEARIQMFEAAHTKNIARGSKPDFSKNGKKHPINPFPRKEFPPENFPLFKQQESTAYCISYDLIYIFQLFLIRCHF